MRVVVLAGGYGGARMAHGFALLDGVELTVIVNTGDDLELHGLHVSPDLDTVMYTLAGIANPETGWGVRDETWSAAEMLSAYGEPTWFRLGDRDLATHIVRTQMLASGKTLTDATARLTNALRIRARLLPMSDEPIATKIGTATGWLDFQEYFVRHHFADAVTGVRFDGAEAASPAPGTLAALGQADLVVIAPSNPFVSVAPILAVPGMLDALRGSPARVVAISPIVGGSALRGPAAAMLSSLANDRGAAGVARHYAGQYPGLVNEFVIDESDAAEAPGVGTAGFTVRTDKTLLTSPDERRSLAERLL